MKIIAFCLYKYFPYGGMERDFMRIALQCQAQGFAIRVYTTKWDGEIPEGFDVVLVGRKGFVNHKRLVNFAKDVAIQLKKTPVDIVVGFNKIPGLDIYFAADVCFAKKFVLKNFLTKILPRYKTYLKLENSVFGENSTTKVMCLLQSRADDFKEFYNIEDSRIKVLPLALDKDFGKRLELLDRKKVREEFGVSEDRYLICQVSSAFHTKGVDRVIEALGNIKESNVHYLVIGAGDSSKLQKQINKHNLSERVTFTGGRDDIADLLGSADLLIHPARVESTGLTLLEAMAVNLPIISSGICGYSPIVRAVGGVVLSEPFSQSEFECELSRCLDREFLSNMKSVMKDKFNDLNLSGLPEAAAEFIISEIY